MGSGVEEEHRLRTKEAKMVSTECQFTNLKLFAFLLRFTI